MRVQPRPLGARGTGVVQQCPWEPGVLGVVQQSLVFLIWITWHEPRTEFANFGTWLYRGYIGGLRGNDVTVYVAVIHCKNPVITSGLGPATQYGVNGLM